MSTEKTKLVALTAIDFGKNTAPAGAVFEIEAEQAERLVKLKAAKAYKNPEAVVKATKAPTVAEAYPFLTPEQIEALKKAGLDTAEKVAKADKKTLDAVPGIGDATLAKILG